MALTERLDWVLEDPRQVIDRLPFESTAAPLTPFLILVSAILSLAVSDTWMVPATAPALFPTALLYGVDMLAWVFLFSRVSRLWKVPKIEFRAWWRAGIVALVPLHLALPAALLLRPFGTSGYVVYELFKLFILSWILRRWVWAVELLNGWPAWASTLLVASPFFLVVAVLLVGSLLSLGAASIAILGVLK